MWSKFWLISPICKQSRFKNCFTNMTISRVEFRPSWVLNIQLDMNSFKTFSKKNRILIRTSYSLNDPIKAHSEEDMIDQRTAAQYWTNFTIFVPVCFYTLTLSLHYCVVLPLQYTSAHILFLECFIANHYPAITALESSVLHIPHY